MISSNFLEMIFKVRFLGLKSVKPRIHSVDDLLYNQIHLTEVEFTHKKGLDIKLVSIYKFLSILTIIGLGIFFEYFLLKMEELACLLLGC